MDSKLKILEYEKFSNVKKWVDIASKYNVKKVYMEHVWSMGTDGSKSTTTFITNFGKQLGWLEALNYSYKLIAPLKWQNFLIPIGRSSDRKIRKEQIMKVIRSAYPDMETTFKTKRNWDIADAIAICLYGVSEELKNGKAKG